MVFRLFAPLPLSALALVAGAAFYPDRPAFGAPVVPAPYAVSAIDRVWSSHRVGYAMVVTDAAVIVAYYDANRQLTVASRPRAAPAWVYHKLDSWTGWDSHNYIAMSLDSLGQIHIVANLHGDPLVYYRSTQAGDVRTLARVSMMVETAAERRMTYPIFLRDAGGRLIMKYRDGQSGNGNEVYNVYDAATRSWKHLLSTPLTDGEGHRNAYFVGPRLGPDGWFHLAWVWRESPMAESNHDLSYAKSRDLVHWVRADGSPLTLPIRLASAEIVDAVPVEGGMINNNTVIGFDPAGHTMITYHKFDAAGNTQIFVARWEGTRWRIAQISDWRGFRWDFRGGGSLDSRLSVRGPEPVGKDRVRVDVVRDGKPISFLADAASLKRVEERPGDRLADRLRDQIPVLPGMILNTLEDSGNSGIALAWPTRPAHRDLPDEDIAEPTVLRLIEPQR